MGSIVLSLSNILYHGFRKLTMIGPGQPDVLRCQYFFKKNILSNVSPISILKVVQPTCIEFLTS